MPDFTRIRSLDDLAAAKQLLQQQADRQAASLQKNATRIQRELNHLLSRFRKVGHTFSSVVSFFTPISVFTPKLSKGALLISLLKRILRRFRKH